MGYWKDSLLIGVPKVDEQHKKLVAAIDELIDACNKGQGRSKIESTLHFVIEYTKEHFKDEEALQLQHNYPGLAEHKKLHEEFINKISQFESAFDASGSTIPLTIKINKTLVEWLVKHITVEDKKIGSYINSK